MVNPSFLSIYIILFFITFILRLPYFFRPMIEDNAICAYIAYAMNAGKILYTDILWNDMPFSNYLMAFFTDTFGFSILRMRIFETIWISFTGIAFYFLILRAYKSRLIALLSAVLYVSVSQHVEYILDLDFKSENYMSLFIVLAAYFMVVFINTGKIIKLFFSGLFLACVFFTKPISFLEPIGFGLFAIYNAFDNRYSAKKTITILLSFCFGYLLIFLLVWILFNINGSWNSFFEMEILRNVQKRQSIDFFSMLINRGLPNIQRTFLEFLPHISALIVLNIYMLIRNRNARNVSVSIFAIFWIITEFVNILYITQATRFAYFQMIFPALVFFCSMSFERSRQMNFVGHCKQLVSNPRTIFSVRNGIDFNNNAVLILYILISLAVLNQFRTQPKFHKFYIQLKEYQSNGNLYLSPLRYNTLKYMIKNGIKNKEIFLLGKGAELYFFTNSISPCRVFNNTFLRRDRFSASDAEKIISELIKCLKEKQTEYILNIYGLQAEKERGFLSEIKATGICSNIRKFPAFERYIKSNYDLEANIREEKIGTSVFKRRHL